jgi:hypothetical protein
MLHAEGVCSPLQSVEVRAMGRQEPHRAFLGLLLEVNLQRVHSLAAQAVALARSSWATSTLGTQVRRVRPWGRKRRMRTSTFSQGTSRSRHLAAGSQDDDGQQRPDAEHPLRAKCGTRGEPWELEVRPIPRPTRVAKPGRAMLRYAIRNTRLGGLTRHLVRLSRNPRWCRASTSGHPFTEARINSTLARGDSFGQRSVSAGSRFGCRENGLDKRLGRYRRDKVLLWCVQVRTLHNSNNNPLQPRDEVVAPAGRRSRQGHPRVGQGGLGRACPPSP